MKRALIIILKILCWVIAISFALQKIDLWLQIDGCLDGGEVWDYAENRCRDDCLAITKANGCIKMTDEQVEIFKDCRHKYAGCVPKKVYEDICRQNHMPINKKTKFCDLEFTLDKCYKLGDDWEYPDTCKNHTDNISK